MIYTINLIYVLDIAMARRNQNAKTGKNKEIEIKEGDKKEPLDSMCDAQ